MSNPRLFELSAVDVRLNLGPRASSLLQSTGSSYNRKRSRQWLLWTCCDSNSRISRLCIPRLHWAPNGHNGEREICANRYITHAYNNATKKLCGKGKVKRPRRRWKVDINMDIKWIDYELSHDNVRWWLMNVLRLWSNPGYLSFRLMNPWYDWAEKKYIMNCETVCSTIQFALIIVKNII